MYMTMTDGVTAPGLPSCAAQHALRICCQCTNTHPELTLVSPQHGRYTAHASLSLHASSPCLIAPRSETHTLFLCNLSETDGTPVPCPPTRKKKNTIILHRMCPAFLDPRPPRKKTTEKGLRCWCSRRDFILNAHSLVDCDLIAEFCVFFLFWATPSAGVMIGPALAEIVDEKKK